MKKYCFGFLLLCVSTLSQAHFTHFEPRVVHAYQDGSGIDILLRMPFPLLLLTDDWKGFEKSQNLAFSQVVGEGSNKRYILNKRELYAEVEQLHTMISNGHQIQINGEQVPFTITAVTLFNSDTRTSFDTLASAQKSLQKPLQINPDAGDVFDLGIDLKLRVENATLDNVDLGLSSSLGERLLVIERVANVVNVYRNEGKSSVTTVGVLDFNSAKPPTVFDRAGVHLLDGFTHILIGFDHIVFLLVLFFSCKTLRQVALLATTFAVGHSISLFFTVQSSPSVDFVAVIELLIAVTVFFSAVSVLAKRDYHLHSTVILVFGMIHGLGFSFVYNELYRDSGYSSLWEMAFFTLGIESGQLVLCLLTLLLLKAMKYYSVPRKNVAAVTYCCALLISGYWIAERAVPALG